MDAVVDPTISGTARSLRRRLVPAAAQGGGRGAEREAASRAAVRAARTAREPAASQKVAWAGNWLLPLFVVLLFVPGAFFVGPLRLNFYKLPLLLAAVPLGLHWIRGRAGPVTVVDGLVLFSCAWCSLALIHAHQLTKVPLVGTTFLEFFGAYLIGRVLVRDAADFRRFFRWFLFTLVAMLPFALVELVVAKRLLVDIASKVLSVTQYEIGGRSSNLYRWGLRRVSLGFEHPILFGIAASFGLSNVYYVYYTPFLTRIRNTGLVLFMVFASLSSGPWLAALLQCLMIGWNGITFFIRARWILLAVVGAITLSVLQMVLPGGLLGFIINEVIFNPYGGMNRIDIFRFGTAEALRNPIFGIGLNDWVRGYWMAGTFDNFWLLLAVRYGMPSLMALWLGMGLSTLYIMAGAPPSEEITRYRNGYLIGLAGMVVVLGTVHIWGAPVPLVMCYIGMGSWFFTGEEAMARPAAEPVRLRDMMTARVRPAGRRPGRGADDPTAASGQELPGAAQAASQRAATSGRALRPATGPGAGPATGLAAGPAIGGLAAGPANGPQPNPKTSSPQTTSTPTGPLTGPASRRAPTARGQSPVELNRTPRT